MTDEIPTGSAAAVPLLRAKGASARRGARLAVVQALYSMEIADLSAPSIMAEFDEARLGLGPDEEPGAEPDVELFKSIIEGVVRDQKEIDTALIGVLAAGWRLDRIDSIARAVLRAATYEILGRPLIPAAGIIEAYVELAHQFLDEPAPGFINGALDTLARKVRPGELSQKGS